jgi:hypothetical protein
MMKKLFVLFALGLIALPLSASAAGTAASSGGMATAWFQCRSDKDCVPVQTACNKWEGVNKKYARNFSASIPKMSLQGTGCPAPSVMSAMKHAAQAKCIAAYCTVLLPKPLP